MARRRVQVKRKPPHASVTCGWLQPIGANHPRRNRYSTTSTLFEKETIPFCGARASAMAGRLLPIALATVAGISIGIATFDGEFKEQRRKRLEEEYKRYVLQVDGSPWVLLTMLS
jgi:hypothetical protein